MGGEPPDARGDRARAPDRLGCDRRAAGGPISPGMGRPAVPGRARPRVPAPRRPPLPGRGDPGAWHRPLGGIARRGQCPGRSRPVRRRFGRTFATTFFPDWHSGNRIGFTPREAHRPIGFVSRRDPGGRPARAGCLPPRPGRGGSSGTVHRGAPARCAPVRAGPNSNRPFAEKSYADRNGFAPHNDAPGIGFVLRDGCGTGGPCPGKGPGRGSSRRSGRAPSRSESARCAPARPGRMTHPSLLQGVASAELGSLRARHAGRLASSRAGAGVLGWRVPAVEGPAPARSGAEPPGSRSRSDRGTRRDRRWSRKPRGRRPAREGSAQGRTAGPTVGPSPIRSWPGAIPVTQSVPMEETAGRARIRRPSGAGTGPGRSPRRRRGGRARRTVAGRSSVRCRWM
ncbi:hypothetical protein ElP_67380 [Tautonia plasticadhaerens]|uniref:Uncharacterized protein n=1 Tax=Tautonia plasticadhaerens TaxID=2527974 RepID=A0A518HD49_9BACT|nr:hypothetical protein ElP_67380 [Tautonia plasticadhaerens]